MPYCFKNLIFQGGGVNGIAYVGALTILEEKGVLKDIQRVGGTSVGALNAMLTALNYNNQEVLKILKELDFKNFASDSKDIFGGIKRMFIHYGWHSGDFLHNWIGELIKNKTGSSESTFADIKQNGGFKELFILGTNISTKSAEVFSPEDTPDMLIVDAIRISMSIPFYFASTRSKLGDVYIDGGPLCYYPIRLFDKKHYMNKDFPDYYASTMNNYFFNRETLGLKVDTKEDIGIFRDQKKLPRKKIKGFVSFVISLLQTLVSQHDNNHINSDDRQRTVYIDSLGLGAINFKLSQETKDKLFESGKAGAREYFQWFDNRQNHQTKTSPEINSGELDPSFHIDNR